MAIGCICSLRADKKQEKSITFPSANTALFEQENFELTRNAEISKTNSFLFSFFQI
jgi:hypothetical protein